MVGFGMRLKSLRKKKNLTQKELAAMLQLTKSVISAYELEIRYPSYDVLINISKIFKVSTDYLLGVEHTQEIDTSGLTAEEINALNVIIKSMKIK